jgi:hypothetical protein
MAEEEVTRKRLLNRTSDEAFRHCEAQFVPWRMAESAGGIAIPCRAA